MYLPETRTGRWSPRGNQLNRHLALALVLGLAILGQPPIARPMTLNVSLEPLGFRDIAGWDKDDHAEAFVVFVRSCREVSQTGRGFVRDAALAGNRTDWLDVCAKASAMANHAPSAARKFFEDHFSPFLVRDVEHPQGLFTGYFEPEVSGDLHPHGEFSVPLYGKPSDLIAFEPHAEKVLGLRYGRLQQGLPQAYFTRREIEEGALAGNGLELVWLKSWADAFFMQVQGSGRVRLPDGSIMRLAYAAKTGLPYTAIGGILVERGVFDRSEMSMQAIRSWMDAHPDKARALMWENRSYVFFRIVSLEDPGLGAPGAQQVQLTPLRSLAIDRAIWAFGTPLWIDTELPPIAGSAPIRRLGIAQDTGSAIKGAARADMYFGFGEEAATRAGHMKSQGRMIALLPSAVARRLKLKMAQ
jgi:membrane-bound lytic murein transglycosylase A